MHKTQSLFIFLCGFMVILVSAIGLGVIIGYKSGLLPQIIITPPKITIGLTDKVGMKQFGSENDFKEYISNLTAVTNTMQNAFGSGAIRETMQKSGIDTPSAVMSQDTTVDRASSTNVQVLGIDEPDIVKVGGNKIYYSTENYLYYPVMERTLFSDEMANSSVDRSNTKIINASPIDNLGIDSSILKNGTLLLSDNILIVFSDNQIFGYDVQDPKKPAEAWNIELETNQEILSARLYQKTIYLITRAYINTAKPCPYIPLTVKDAPVEIRCEDIYHPIADTQVDSTYTAMVIDPGTGEIAKQISMVGLYSSTVAYMSENALYVTFSQSTDLSIFFYNFLNTEGKELVPESLIAKLAKLKDYELSSGAKLIELQSILQTYENSLSSDDRAMFENNLNNKLSEYLTVHSRSLEKTQIVKIGLSDFSIMATGIVPGDLLNQFSLDEYNGNLRVATTIGNQTIATTQSINDVYILGNKLQELGSVLNLGEGEKIYSARFIGDKGYVVTFRQTDPFYVLDLKNPEKPVKTGELKIPGYSSYLHPISDEVILGLGAENGKVKLSLFDVSDPSNPTELSKYFLDDYWSEAQNNHHAFLQDADHQVFFLPGSSNGYVFSYENSELKLKKAAADIQAKRAVYLNDFLYILGDNKIIVLNENDWSVAGSLNLN